MKANIGKTDRIVRSVVGVVLIGLSIFGVIGLWGWIGLLLLLSAWMSFCPAYALFKCKTSEPEKELHFHESQK
jgi:hypothetical protein